jgi:hypothetical protein
VGGLEDEEAGELEGGELEGGELVGGEGGGRGGATTKPEFVTFV